MTLETMLSIRLLSVVVGIKKKTPLGAARLGNIQHATH